VNWRRKALAAAVVTAVAQIQFKRLSQGRSPGRSVPAILALLRGQVSTVLKARRYRAWMRRQQPSPQG
jgi:hypothetical protein